MSGVSACVDECAKVVKRQRVCQTKVAGCLHQLIALASAARDKAAAGDASAASDLAANVEAAGLIKEMNAQTKDLHTAVGKLGKVCAASHVSMYAAPYSYRWGGLKVGKVLVAALDMEKGRPCNGMPAALRRPWTRPSTGRLTSARRCETSASTRPP